MAAAASISPFAASVVGGPARRGRVLGHGHVLVRDDVITLTPPGAPRMPNGVETAIELEAGDLVRVGGGAISARRGTVVSGPLWDPRPRPRFVVSARPPFDGDVVELAGLGPGLTPLGDDILVGFLAARALCGEDSSALAGRAAARTTALSRTLLLLAADRRLPEPAIRLLEYGEIEPLLAFGATSGSGLLVGLGLYHAEAEGVPVRTLAITLPLPEPRRFEVRVRHLIPERVAA